ncbi:MAG: phosphoglycerate kinase [Nitrososphaeria archaeon]
MFKTMDDFDFANRTAIVRVDFNSTVDPSTKKLLDDERIRLHSGTIRELAQKGAKVVVLAHQGRLGDPDYTTLEQHSRRLSEILGRHVGYIDDIVGDRAVNAIRALKSEEILVLENVRSLNEETAEKTIEEQSRTTLVKTLAPLADVFVMDAFAAAHRGHASIVGFTVVMPTVLGRVMERELKALERIRSVENRPIIYILGGSKVKEGVEIIEYVLSNDRADHIITGGLVAQLFLVARGLDTGSRNKKALSDKGLLGLVPKAESILNKFSGRVLLPVDFAVNADGKRKEIQMINLSTEYEIWDIGGKTMAIYESVLETAEAIMIHGPMGVYEVEPFLEGTRRVFQAAVRSGAFTVAGGGHTIAALSKLGLYDKVSYVSSGGGALLESLMGKKLPALAAMEEYQK